MEEEAAAGPDVEVALGQAVGQEEAGQVQAERGLAVGLGQAGVIVHGRAQASGGDQFGLGRVADDGQILGLGQRRGVSIRQAAEASSAPRPMFRTAWPPGAGRPACRATILVFLVDGRADLRAARERLRARCWRRKRRPGPGNDCGRQRADRGRADRGDPAERRRDPWPGADGWLARRARVAEPRTSCRGHGQSDFFQSRFFWDESRWKGLSTHQTATATPAASSRDWIFAVWVQAVEIDAQKERGRFPIKQAVRSADGLGCRQTTG